MNYTLLGLKKKSPDRPIDFAQALTCHAVAQSSRPSHLPIGLPSSGAKKHRQQSANSFRPSQDITGFPNKYKSHSRY